MYLFIENPHPGKKLQVLIQHVNPPIADRRFDYAATVKGYEPGDVIGRGESETAAITDLIEQLP